MKGLEKIETQLQILKAELTDKQGQAFFIGFGVLVFIWFMAYAIGASYFGSILFSALLFGMMGVAWNFLGGYTGYQSYGHAMFFGIGAYTTIVLAVKYSVTPWIGILIGGALALGFGILISFPLFRLTSSWFCLGTIVIPEILRQVFKFWPLVNKAYGIQFPFMATSADQLYYLQFYSPFPYFWLVVGWIGIELLVMYVLLKGKTGYYLKSIRENEMTAKSIGINVFKYKTIAMAVSSFFTGIAGGLYVVRVGFMDPPTAFDLISISVMMLIAALLGGMGSLVGPIIGGLILIPIRNYIRGWFSASQFLGLYFVIIGVVLAIISTFFPSGITGWLKKKGYWFKKEVE